MLNVHQLRELIIKPALYDLVVPSDDAVELLVFTCAVESDGGTFVKQLNGPALGIYQMEPATHNDIWQNFIMKQKSLYMKMLTNFDCSRIPDEFRLIYDLRYATAMTRIHYLRVSKAIPSKDDVQGLWDYYKTYYNSSQGAAQEDKTIQKYLSFINN